MEQLRLSTHLNSLLHDPCSLTMYTRGLVGGKLHSQEKTWMIMWPCSVSVLWQLCKLGERQCCIINEMCSLFSFMESRDENMYISLIEVFRERTNVWYDVFTYLKKKRIGMRCPWAVLFYYKARRHHCIWVINIFSNAVNILL